VTAAQCVELSVYRDALLLVHQEAQMNMMLLMRIPGTVAGVPRLSHIYQVHRQPPDFGTARSRREEGWCESIFIQFPPGKSRQPNP
jgi:hypothetical protein